MTSPDPVVGDLTRPQTLNAYSYVANNPLSFIDPSGFDGESIGPVVTDSKAGDFERKTKDQEDEVTRAGQSASEAAAVGLVGGFLIGYGIYQGDPILILVGVAIEVVAGVIHGYEAASSVEESQATWQQQFDQRLEEAEGRTPGRGVP